MRKILYLLSKSLSKEEKHILVQQKNSLQEHVSIVFLRDAYNVDPEFSKDAYILQEEFNAGKDISTYPAISYGKLLDMIFSSDVAIVL
jgi:hypothetical protein